MEQKLDSLVSRLETVTSKLESVASRGGAGGTGGAGSVDTPEWVVAFDNVMKSLDEFYRLSNLIGGEVSEISELVRSALSEVKAFIVLAGNHKKPTDQIIAKLLSNVNAASLKVSSVSIIVLFELYIIIL